mgnify:CR=1 FL=1
MRLAAVIRKNQGRRKILHESMKNCMESPLAL